jgi:hypothetical protein
MDVSNIINGAAATIRNNKLTTNIINNPLYTSLLLLAISLIFIFIIIQPSDKKSILRYAFWFGLIILVVQFTHYYCCKFELEKNKRNEVTEAIIKGSSEILSDDVVAITPRISDNNLTLKQIII